MEVRKKYYKNGNIQEEHYYENDKIHRLDGPAITWYDKYGNIEQECYYQNGKKHRLDGPAIIYYNQHGNTIAELFYINNKQIDEFKYYVMTGSMK